MEPCASCFRDTKYSCIYCSLPLCNVCSIAELNDDTCGWIAGKRVGYCKPCKENLLRKGKLNIDTGNGAVKTSEVVEEMDSFSLQKRYV